MLNVKSIVIMLVIVAAIAVIFVFFVLPKLPADFIQIFVFQARVLVKYESVFSEAVVHNIHRIIIVHFSIYVQA
jgi:hypothetical protein